MNRFNFVTVLQTALIKFHEYFMKCLRLAQVCNAWTNWTNLLTSIVTVLWSFSAITWIHQNSPLFEKMKCVFFDNSPAPLRMQPSAAVNISHLCPQQLCVSLFSHPFCSWHSKMLQSISQGALLSSWPEIYTSRCLCCTGEECSPQNDDSLCFLVGYWIFLTMWVHLFEDGCKKHAWTTSCDPHMTNLLTSEEAYKQTNKNA